MGKEKKTKYDKRKFLLAFLCVMGVFAAVRYAFSIDIPLHVEEKAELACTEADVPGGEEEFLSVGGQEEEDVVIEEEDVVEDVAENVAEDVPVDTVLTEDALQMEDGIADADSANGRPHRIKGVWSYDKCFPDIQDTQILAAQRHGITPVKNRQEAEQLVKSHKLVNICHSPYYIVDDLTHSIPYLVPRAQHLLNTICMNFLDSCQVKGLPPHLLMVTSVMRTTDDVSSLQRGNKNATTNSCHCYGTTVDIAYNRFMPVTGEYHGYGDLLRWDEPMKKVLSEVLYDLREQGKCYVKYERKQGCFHLTCR